MATKKKAAKKAAPVKKAAKKKKAAISISDQEQNEIDMMLAANSADYGTIESNDGETIPCAANETE